MESSRHVYWRLYRWVIKPECNWTGTKGQRTSACTHKYCRHACLRPLVLLYPWVWAESAGKILEKFIYIIWPEFSFDSEKTEIYAKRYFKKRLNEYLEGKCEPYDVCKMINPIEDIFHFPSWLGDMFNACDWIEPGDKLNGKHSRYFRNEVKETLKRLKKL